MSVALDQKRCTQCGRCVRDCPSHIFALIESGVQIKEKRLEACLHCGHCNAVCPAQAITLDACNPDTLLPAATTLLNEEQRHGLFRSRRSIRHFKKEALPRDLISAALEDAAYAPTARNSRHVHWQVLTKPETLYAITSEVANAMRGASGRYSQVAKAFDSGTDIILHSAPCLFIAHAPSDWDWGKVDCAIATTYLELALHTRGIGSCWAGFVVATAAQGAVPALQIPPGHSPCAGLMAGFPAMHYAKLPVRESNISWI